MEKYINHSGGALGSDTAWGTFGILYGVENKHYWYNNITPNGNTEITEEDAIEGQKKVTIAARQMGRIAETHQVRDERLIRNWSQVKYSESIFAITTMLSVGNEMNYGKKALIRQGKGGTGYAIQMAINECKPVYVYDQIRKGWFKNIDGIWSRSETPILTKNFSGIGTREINNFGIQAIKDVYNKTFNTRKTYTGEINNLNENQIFVFGSNTEGRHGKGSALKAKINFGAIYGKSEGIQGQSFAIITKDLTKRVHPSRTKEQIIEQIHKLYEYARLNPDKEFIIPYTGQDVNLNAYSSIDMAKMFSNENIPFNIIFEKSFYELIIE